MLLKSLFKHWTYQVFSPGTVLREKYEAFKLLLENDKCAHEVMAELEEISIIKLKLILSSSKLNMSNSPPAFYKSSTICIKCAPRATRA